MGTSYTAPPITNADYCERVSTWNWRIPAKARTRDRKKLAAIYQSDRRLVRIFAGASTLGSAHTASSKTARLVSEIAEAVRESALNLGVPIDGETKRMAIKLATLLPASVPTPEVAFDSDGEISFDWLGPANKIFSVSIDRSGRLAYAGRFGEKRKNNGVEQLSETCPTEIIQGIERAVS